MDHVKLRNDQGCFHDQESGLRIVRDKVVPLKHPIGKLTLERLESSALIRCAVPQEAGQEVCQAGPAEIEGDCKEDAAPTEGGQEACHDDGMIDRQDAGPTETTPDAGTPVIPGIAEPIGSGIGEGTDGEVVAADAAPKPSPAKPPRKRKKKE